MNERTVPYRKFENEKNAKNRAYYFIISHGYLDEFIEFCDNDESSDPHRDSLRILDSIASIVLNERRSIDDH